MTVKDAQKSVIEFKPFKIPIEDYEEDMMTKAAKRKKADILDLFNNSNMLGSEEEFEKIEYNLHDVCREGDLELIKIYLSKTIENDSKTLKFKIDETNQTASLFEVNDYIREAIIPRTVKHKSVDYLITSICGISRYNITIKFVEISISSNIKIISSYAFEYCENLTKVEISPNSNLQIIKRNAFTYSKIEELFFQLV